MNIPIKSEVGLISTFNKICAELFKGLSETEHKDNVKYTESAEVL